MPSSLPINLDDLLRLRRVESSRVEFKATWNDVVAPQVIRTICAFANDVQNLNGGYVIIGVEEKDGVAILPPRGLAPESIDRIHKEIRGQCNRISPAFQPVLSPEVIDGHQVLVVWAPGSDIRPHQAPESKAKGAPAHYYVRAGSETIEARGRTLDELMQQAAKVPFDDRRANQVPLDDVRESRVREFLRDIKSELVHERDGREILRSMRLSARTNGHEVPKNVALLFFSEAPETWFPGARIEVAQFADDASGAIIEENTFRGPIHEHLRAALDHLRHLSTRHLQKHPDRAEVLDWVSYPFAALEESLVNAVYHRSYDGEPEPTKVYLYPDRMEIISYPGPAVGIRHEHFAPGARVPPVPARNRRIGELLKDLRLAEARSTGIPKVVRAMEENGSPRPQFDFGDDRTYFCVTLPAHPEYVAISALRDAAHLRAVGNEEAAEQRLTSAAATIPGSGVLATELIKILGERERIEDARTVFDRFRRTEPRSGEGRVIATMADAYLNAKRADEATALLDLLPATLSAADAIEGGILERRAGRQQRAHQIFETVAEAVQSDARALLEFAQTKIRIADEIANKRRQSPFDGDTRTKLLREAREMLRRVTQMDAPPARHAWAWFELGRVLRWLHEPGASVREALEKAIALRPIEEKFRRELASLGAKKN